MTISGERIAELRDQCRSIVEMRMASWEMFGKQFFVDVATILDEYEKGAKRPTVTMEQADRIYDGIEGFSDFQHFIRWLRKIGVNVEKKEGA